MREKRKSANWKKPKKVKKKRKFRRQIKKNWRFKQRTCQNWKKQNATQLTEFGKKNKLAKQMVDLALLANGMLKGADLDKFVKRSVELIK